MATRSLYHAFYAIGHTTRQSRSTQKRDGTPEGNNLSQLSSELLAGLAMTSTMLPHTEGKVAVPAIAS